MKLPVHFMRTIGELDDMVIEYRAGLRFVDAEVTERGGVLEGKLQRLKRVVKAHEVDRTRELPRRPQDGERVGSRAQTDIPDHEFAGMIFEALAEPELIDVKRFSLGNGADDRMKGLAVRQRTDAVSA